MSTIPSLDEIEARGRRSRIPLEWALQHMGDWHPRTARDMIRDGRFPLRVHVKPGRGGEHYTVSVGDLIDLLEQDETPREVFSVAS